MAVAAGMPQTTSAMTNNRHVLHRNSLLVLLWGLILTKCFTFEYLVQIYEVPVNSALYVWSLSLFMAAAATFVFLRLRESEGNVRPLSHPANAFPGACLLAALVVVGAGFGANIPDPSRIPAWLAVLLGLGYGAHGIFEKRNADLLSAGVWLLGAVLLFPMRAPESLRVFGALILLASVFPALWRLIRQRREIESVLDEARHAGD